MYNIKSHTYILFCCGCGSSAGIHIRSVLFEASFVYLAILFCKLHFLIDINGENVNSVGKEGLRYLFLIFRKVGYVKIK